MPDTPETPDPAVPETPAVPEVPETPQVPDHVQKELEKVRAEAAKYRVRAREAEEKAKTADPEAHAKQLAELSDKSAVAAAALEAATLGASKLEVALAALAPEAKDAVLALAGLLQGSTSEELTAHAATVSTLLGATKKPRATDPSQGAGGEVKPNVTGRNRLIHAYENPKGSD